MELSNWVIEDGVCVVKKIIPELKSGSVVLKDKAILDSLNIFYGNLGIKKGSLIKGDNKSILENQKQELIRTIKEVSKLDSSIISFDGKKIRINNNEMDEPLRYKTNLILSLQDSITILSRRHSNQSAYYYYPSAEMCNLLKDIFDGQVSTPEQAALFIQNMDIKVEKYIVKCENIKRAIIDKYIRIIGVFDDLLEDDICRNERDLLKNDLDNFYIYIQQLHLVELSESLVQNQKIFTNIIFILSGQISVKQIVETKNPLLIGILDKVKLGENPLKILLDTLLKYTTENDLLIENIDKLIFRNIINEGMLGENFINFNKCINLNISKIIKYNKKVIQNWNTCGNPDCDSLSKNVCSGCHNIRYCGTDCQKEHWNKKEPGSIISVDHNSLCRGRHLEIGFKKSEFETAQLINNKIEELTLEGIFNIVYEDDETEINIDLISNNKEVLKKSLLSLFDAAFD